MILHYRVKFLNKSKYVYGTAESIFSADALHQLKQNKILVRDAIYPKMWDVQEYNIVDIPLVQAGEYDEYEDHIQKAYIAAKTLSDSVDGFKEGKLLKFKFANAYVYYVIHDAMEGYVYLEWRGFDLNAYCIPQFGYNTMVSIRRCVQWIKEEKCFL